MIKKHVCIVLFVLLGVLFALSSCGESGTETPSSALSGSTLTYDVAAEVNANVNSPPVWDPVLDKPGDVTYSITPPLDEATTGLRFDTTTGVISGTPTNVTATGEYTITATAKNPGAYTGTQTATINITISLPDITTYKLSYPLAGALEVSDPVSISPEWTPVLATPGDVTYSITPPLDEATTGLRFDTTTGTISGTPTNVTATGEYTITATAKNPGAYTGTQTATINITIKPLNISTYKFSYPLATGITSDITAAPVWYPAPPNLEVTYTVTPELPTGLNLVTSTGSITGSFANLPHASAYTITATATGGTYTGSTTAVFLDTLLLEAHTPNTEGTAIRDRDGLAAMANDPTGTYHLTNHIDLGTDPWLPLFSDTPFTGKLHGNGYAIYNLKIEGLDTANSHGLFAAIANATVKNLGLGVTRITGGAMIGALAGTSFGTQTNITSAAMNTAASDTAHITAKGTVTISNEEGSYVGGLVGSLGSAGTLTGNSIGLSVSGIGNNVGGLAGYNNGTLIGYATGDIDGKATNTGGLVGYNAARVTGYSTGAVKGTGENVGGLVGLSNGLVKGYATGTVEGIGEYVGGIVGWNTGTVIGYTTGSVTSTTKGEHSSVGGLVGGNRGSVTGYTTGAVKGTAKYVGGIVGWNTDNVTGYSTGEVVTGGTFVGGLVGFIATTGKVITGYATGSVRGTSSGGLAGGNAGSSVIGYATAADVGSGLQGASPSAAKAYGYWDKESTGKSSSSSTTGAPVSATRNIAYNADSSSYTDSWDGQAIFTLPEFIKAFTLPTESKTWPKLKVKAIDTDPGIDFAFDYTVAGEQKVFTLVQPTVKDSNGDGSIEVDMPTQNNFEAGWLIP